MHAEPEMEVEAAPTEADPDEELAQGFDEDEEEFNREEYQNDVPCFWQREQCLPAQISH